MNNHFNQQYFAAIDLGSQTFRIAVAGIRRPYFSDNDGKEYLVVEPAYTGLYNTRLVRRLNDPSYELPFDVAYKIRDAIIRFSPLRVFISGTEALRRLSQRSSTVIERLEEILSHKIKILSPEEEGWLTALGAITAINAKDSSCSIEYPVTVIDVGGGSTELIFIPDNATEWSFNKSYVKDKCYQHDINVCHIKSIPVGAVTLHEGNYDNGLDLLKSTIGEPPYSRTKTLIGSGGTATTIASIIHECTSYAPEVIRGTVIDAGRIKGLIEKISSMSLVERRRIKGLEPERADIIIDGVKIIDSAMDILNIFDITISDGGLLMGLIIDLLKKEIRDAKFDWRRLYI